MATVHVRPSGIEFAVEADESIFEAAERAGYRWPTVCGGVGSCTTCFAIVTDGVENSSEISPFEREGLGRIDVPASEPGQLRLACQLRISGDVTVLRSGVRPRRPAPKP
jgi:adenylate cyclase